MSFILDNFGRTLQKRKESATMILISENYKTGGSKMSGQRYTVNAMGEQCPIPVVKTKKVLDSIQGDAEIEVLVDNETAVQNLTRMGKNTGAEVFSEKKSDKGRRSILHSGCKRRFRGRSGYSDNGKRK